MVDNQVLTFAVAIYVGMSLTKFFNAIIRDLVLPLLSPLASSEGDVAKLVIVSYGSPVALSAYTIKTKKIMFFAIFLAFSVN